MSTNGRMLLGACLGSLQADHLVVRNVASEGLSCSRAINLVAARSWRGIHRTGLRQPAALPAFR